MTSSDPLLSVPSPMPCPWCGKTPHVTGPVSADTYEVACGSLSHALVFMRGPLPTVIEQWNSRSPSRGEGPATVTRFEVIDHRESIPPYERGRNLALYGVAVELSYQDNGRTLKVFVNDPATSSQDSTT